MENITTNVKDKEKISEEFQKIWSALSDKKEEYLTNLKQKQLIE